MDGLTTADGRRLAYRRTGQGRTLVCHGGGPGFSSLYLSDLGGLDEHLELILLDPRGTGASDRPGGPNGYAIADYTADLEELREHLGLERMSVLGHSHGGIVAMDWAAKYPDHADHLVLASTLARWAPEQKDAMDAAVATHADEPWYEDAKAAFDAELAGEFSSDEELAEIGLREFPFYFAHYGDEERAYLDTLRSEIPNADALHQWEREIFETFDLRPELGEITGPTLVITGEEDFITGPPSARELTAGIEHAETVLLPDTGHFIFVESPEAFRDAVLAFLGVAAEV
jgi:pimeloyl-ACP methyl ester carboxylesterase